MAQIDGFGPFFINVISFLISFLNIGLEELTFTIFLFALYNVITVL